MRQNQDVYTIHIIMYQALDAYYSDRMAMDAISESMIQVLYILLCSVIVVLPFLMGVIQDIQNMDNYTRL